MINLDNFDFDSRTDTPSFTGKIPSGLKTKMEFLQAVSKVFNFPDYFGENWDAFEECIRDLSWLPNGIIFMKHYDLPMEGDDSSRKIYLEVLSDAVSKWKSVEGRKLRVYFPKSTESVVGRYVNDKLGEA